MTHIALLRGVNVGGAGRLPMADLRAMLMDLGLTRPVTYIQSGNAVFDSDLAADVLAPLIGDAILARFGFAPAVFMATPGDLQAALTDHPFTGADPARAHVFFLDQEPVAVDDTGLRALAAAGEGWHLSGRRFTLHTPAGIGRSKLAEKLHKFLPGGMTARNLRTVAALAALCAAR